MYVLKKYKPRKTKSNFKYGIVNLLQNITLKKTYSNKHFNTRSQKASNGNVLRKKEKTKRAENIFFQLDKTLDILFPSC